MRDERIECPVAGGCPMPVEMYELRRQLFSPPAEVDVYVEVQSKCEVWRNEMIHAVGAGLHGVAFLVGVPLVRERLWQNVRIILRQMEAGGWQIFATTSDNMLSVLIARGQDITNHKNWRKMEETEAWRQKSMNAIDAWLLALPVPEAQTTYPSERKPKKLNQCSS